MRKAIATFSVVMAAIVLSSALHANFTLFDLAKDSVFIARGEFTGLERTTSGDRLTLHCVKMIKGDLVPGSYVTLEAFEPAPADDALGREVIVCFTERDGKYKFLYHPFASRSFMFETDDVAPNGLDQNEQALRNFMAINAPHEEEIKIELSKRLEMQEAGYEGQYDDALINQWKAELLNQISWAGTRAAKDAAKALVEHKLFKGKTTVAELHLVGSLVPHSAVGTLERSYMLELIRTENSAHPSFEAQMGMLREETSQACVGKLSNLMSAVENREMVLSTVGQLANDATATPQMRVNALQVLQALADTDGLPYVQSAIQAELQRGEDYNKDVLRRAFSALRSTPDASSIQVLNQALGDEIVKSSWELTQRAWIAYSMIDNANTNAELQHQWQIADSFGKRRFFQKLLPSNKIIRTLIIVHPED